MAHKKKNRRAHLKHARHRLQPASQQPQQQQHSHSAPPHSSHPSGAACAMPALVENASVTPPPSSSESASPALTPSPSFVLVDVPPAPPLQTPQPQPKPQPQPQPQLPSKQPHQPDFTAFSHLSPLEPLSSSAAAFKYRRPRPTVWQRVKRVASQTLGGVCLVAASPFIGVYFVGSKICEWIRRWRRGPQKTFQPLQNAHRCNLPQDDPSPNKPWVMQRPNATLGDDSPAHWEKVDPAHGNTSLVLLDKVRHADEIAHVTACFKRTYPAEIKSVHRVQNKHLYDRYLRKQAEMEKSGHELKKDLVVFHGTRLTPPALIHEGRVGFDPSKGVSASGWCWFATEARYSANGFAHSVEQPNMPFTSDKFMKVASYQRSIAGLKQIFLCRITVEAQPRVIRDGLCGKHGRALMCGPKIYTLADGEQTYPEYLITFATS